MGRTPLKKILYSALPTYGVLLLTLGITILIWYQWKQQEKLQARDKHSQYITLEKDKINLRINSFMENLYAIQAASKSNQTHLSQSKWNSFANKLGVFSRYSSIQAVSAYTFAPESNSLKLFISTQNKDQYKLQDYPLTSKQKARVISATKHNLPFAFISNQEMDKKGAVLNLFLFDYKLKNKIYFSFQIHLPLLLEELFGDRAQHEPIRSGAGYTEVLSVDIAGARHNIYFVVGQQYSEGSTYVSSLFLASGTIFSLLIFLIMVSLTKSRERALQLAHTMTKEYRLAKLDADKANAAKSDFLARMSHEIRTPLNAIIGVGDLLQESSLTDEQKKYTNLFQTSGEMLLAIINDILDISKIESGRLDIETISFDVYQLAQNAIDLFKAKTSSKGIQLKLSIESSLPKNFLGDPTRIRQILVNLLSNAVKFTERGTIEVIVNQDSGNGAQVSNLVFRVKDNGIGIPENKLQHVFESFTQVDTSTTRKYGGTGLGLSICKKLCLLMGGDIRAENNPDQGACFVLELPLKVDEAEVNAAVHKKENTIWQSLSDDHYSILLAEDTPENAMLIKAFLKKFPGKIEHVNNGLLALQSIQSGKYFDLVLMDIQMPVMDGLTATREIRKWEQENNISPVNITALTAHALNQFQNEGEEAGCTAYLSKPIRKKQLIEYLENTLN